MDASPIYVASHPGPILSLRQGEIISDLVQTHLDLDQLEKGVGVMLSKNHNFCIILSQDCDIEQDCRIRSQLVINNGKLDGNDKRIPNILFCEVATAQAVCNSNSDRVDGKTWKRIKINKDERYHLLQKIAPTCDFSGDGLPELCIDFKRYFTIPTDEVYYRLRTGEAKRRCVLVSPYLEHLSSRFCYYLSRVALPLDHVSE